MTDALRYEWARIRTLRSTYWLILLALVLNAGVAFLVAFATRDDPMTGEDVGAILMGGGPFSPIPFAPVFMAIIGIFATGHEYRHNTVQPTLTTVPQRSRLLTAKIIVVALVSTVVTVLSVAINFAMGMIYWDEAPSFTDYPLDEAMPGYLVLVLLWAILGLALAQLFRGVPSALTIILVLPLVVEGLVIGLSNVEALDFLESIVKFLPFTAGGQLVNVGGETSEFANDYDLFDRWASGGVLAVFVLIILVLAWSLFKKRDA